MSESYSHKIHDIVATYPESTNFTSKELYKNIKKIHPLVTEGMISGFCHRATKTGMLKITGKSNIKGKPIIFRVIDKTITWKFKHSSIGSKKGREIHIAQRTELPIITNDKHSLSTRLMGIAAEVETLENKTLSKFSTDELLAEIKLRTK